MAASRWPASLALLVAGLFRRNRRRARARANGHASLEWFDRGLRRHGPPRIAACAHEGAAPAAALWRIASMASR